MELSNNTLQRKLLLSWLIIPLIVLWMMTNYIIGVFRPISWQSQNLPEIDKPAVNTNAIATPTSVPVTPFQQQDTGAITLWFDDGWISQYTIASPLLEQYGYKGALAVPTHLIGKPGYMGWAQVERMQEKGWETTSHTRNHDCKIFEEDKNVIEDELKGAADDLKSLGLKADQFVSPCGVDSPLMKGIAKQYYLSYRTSEPGFNTIPVEDPYNLEVQTMRSNVSMPTVKSWITYAKTHKKWLIIMFHQVNVPDSEYSITTSRLREILDEIKKEDMPVVLPEQILKVVEQ